MTEEEKKQEQCHALITGFTAKNRYTSIQTSLLKQPVTPLLKQPVIVTTQRSSPNQILAEFKRNQLSKFRLPLDEEISYAVVQRGAKAYPVSSFVSGIFSVLDQTKGMDVEWYSHLSNLHHVIGLKVVGTLLDTYAFVEFETTVNHDGQFLKGFVVPFKDVYFV